MSSDEPVQAPASPVADSAKPRSYCSFISYADEDRTFATRLQTDLETYTVPTRLVGRVTELGRVPPKLYPVFRDRNELRASADLKAVIQKALRASASMVVVCSPHAVKSEWVAKEIAEFNALGRAERICCIVAPDVDPMAAFDNLMPAGLAGHVAGDARGSKDGRRVALLKVVAGILGVDYADLEDRDARRRRVRGSIWAASVLLGVVLSGLAIWSLTDRGRRLDVAVSDAERAKADADVVDAEREFSRGGFQRAIALMARALRTDPSNGIARTTLMTELSDWSWPRATLATDAEALAISPTGSQVAALRRSGETTLWSLDGTEVWSQRGSPPPAGETPQLVFSTDGSHLFRNVSREVVLMDAASGRAIGAPRQFDDDIACVGWQANRAVFVGLHSGQSLHLDAATGALASGPTLSSSGFLEWSGCRLSPDGERVIVSTSTASSSAERGAWLIDFRAAAPRPVKIFNEGWSALVFDPDGDTVTMVPFSGGTRVIDTKTLKTSSEPSGAVLNQMQLEVDRRIAEALAGNASFLDLESKLRGHRPVDVDARHLRLLTQSDGGELRIVSIDEDAEIRLAPPESNIASAHFTSDPRTIVVRTGDGVAGLWDARFRAREVLHLPMWANQFTLRPRFSPDGQLVIGESVEEVAVWQSETGARVWSARPTGAAVSPTGRIAARFKQVGDSGVTVTFVNTSDGTEAGVERRLDGNVRDAVFSEDESAVALDLERPGMRVVVLLARLASTIREIARVPAESEDVFAQRLVITWRGGRLFVGAGNQLRIVDQDGKQVSPPVSCRTARAISPAVFADGKSVACLTATRQLVLFPVSAPPIPHAPFPVIDGITRIDPVGSDRLLLANEGSVAVVRVADGHTVVQQPHTARDAPAAVSADGTRLWTMSDGAVRLWHAESGEPMGAPMPVGSDFHGAAFNQAGTILATSFDTNVQFWDAAKRVGERLGRSIFVMNATTCASLSFSPKGSKLAVGCPQPGMKFYRGAMALIDVLPSLESDSLRVADLAEAVAGTRLNAASGLTPIDRPDRALATLRASDDPFVKWIFADPWTRAPTPTSTVTSDRYITDLLWNGDVELAFALFPGHPSLAKVSRDRLIKPFRPASELPPEDVPAFEDDGEAGGVDSVALLALDDAPGDNWAVRVIADDGFCGSGGCTYPTYVYRRIGRRWSQVGDTNCGTDFRIVVTTRVRHGVRDFFCGDSRMVWTGSRFVDADDADDEADADVDADLAPGVDVTPTPNADASAKPKASVSSNVPNAVASPASRPSAAAGEVKRPARREVVIGPSSLGFVRLRKLPNTKSAEVGRVRPGEVHSYSRIEKNWYWLESKKAWVSGEYAQTALIVGCAPMTDSIQFTIVSTPVEVSEILDLQLRNLASALTPEAMTSQGFVSVRHDESVLRRMNEAAPSIIAKSDGRVVGYALMMPRGFANDVPILGPLFEVLDGLSWNGEPLQSNPRWFVMGQVCVAEGYRGAGIFDGLYRTMAEQYGADFDFTVTEVAARNTRSLRAHARVGFQTLHVYRDKVTGEEWHVVVLDLTLRDGQSASPADDRRLSQP